MVLSKFGVTALPIANLRLRDRGFPASDAALSGEECASATARERWRGKPLQTVCSRLPLAPASRPNRISAPMPALSKEDKLRLLTILLESRHGDLREQNLNRQGKGHFHVSGMGHEAL